MDDSLFSMSSILFMPAYCTEFDFLLDLANYIYHRAMYEFVIETKQYGLHMYTCMHVVYCYIFAFLLEKNYVSPHTNEVYELAHAILYMFSP